MRLPRCAPLLLAMLACACTVSARGEAPTAPSGGLHIVRRYAIPITSYRWQACWRGRLNPFAPPYLVWELVPCTRWEWRCEVVAVPPPPGTLQTIEAPYRSIQAPRTAGGLQRLEEGPPRVGPRMADRAPASASRLRSPMPSGAGSVSAKARSTATPHSAGSDQGWRPARASLR